MSSADNARHWVELLRSIYGDRRWIIATGVLAGATEEVEWLQNLGCPDPFIIAGTLGTGPLPSLPEENVVMLGVGGAGVMAAIRAFFSAAHAELATEVQRRLDAWDTDGTAMVLADFLDVDLPVGRRSQFGARPTAWAALEDKIIIDRLWDGAGITRAPSRVISLDPRVVADALTDLDAGSGIVLAGDNREGWHGGGHLVRFIETAADVEPVTEELAGHCDRARAMPFLEGIPCSIHGTVFPDYVLTVRPAEMVLFRDATKRSFAYAGPAGNWEPPAADIAYMRDVAVAVGNFLRSRYGYRGVFTIDGVMTRDGFLPTELNPRWGPGLRVVTGERPVPTMPIHRALVADVDADWRPAELERHYRESSRDNRSGRGMALVQVRYTETESIPVRFVDGEWVPAEGDAATGTLTRGPAPMGGLVRIEFHPRTRGHSVAPEVLAAWRLANKLWDTGIDATVTAGDMSGSSPS